MQDDFHYYCIAKLADYAGFPQREALTIANASALTDHSQRIRDFTFHDNKTFTPVRTQSTVRLESLLHETQIVTHFPFHFLPKYKDGIANGGNDFVTYPYECNDTAINLFEFVKEKLLTDNDNETCLIQLGISLHTIADTYSHQSFAPIEDENNLVETLKIKYDENDKFQSVKTNNINIGHASVESSPDEPSAIWYRKEDQIVNNRKEIFEPACKTIYKLLIEAKQGILSNPNFNNINYEEEKPFDNIKNEIYRVLFCDEVPGVRDDLKKRMKLWRNSDISLFNKKLDVDEWEDELEDLQDPPPGYLRGNKISTDLSSRVFPYLDYEKFMQTKFYKFHKCAEEQKEFILSFLTSDKPEQDNNVEYLISHVKKYQGIVV